MTFDEELAPLSIRFRLRAQCSVFARPGTGLMQITTRHPFEGSDAVIPTS
jgi:hypothetical protein